MGKTSIEWTDVSWPLANGCRRVSPGCENCYAERLTATRLSKTKKYEGLAVFGPNGPRWSGDIRFWARDLAMPMRLRRPSRIFVADMGDLFYEGLGEDQVAAVFGVMAACPRHVFQVLTKRPELALRWFERMEEQTNGRFVGPALAELAARTFGRAGHPDVAEVLSRAANLAAGRPWPLPNVHVGVSVENQKYADERIPLLLQIPSAVRWVSAEPLLGPVDFTKVVVQREGTKTWSLDTLRGWAIGDERHKCDWIVVGGESGPGARPFDVQWARDVLKQCGEAGVPCFVKQLGSEAHDSLRSIVGGWAPGDPEPNTRLHLANRKGGDPDEWSEDLRVREFPR